MSRRVMEMATLEGSGVVVTTVDDVDFNGVDGAPRTLVEKNDQRVEESRVEEVAKLEGGGVVVTVEDVGVDGDVDEKNNRRGEGSQVMEMATLGGGGVVVTVEDVDVDGDGDGDVDSDVDDDKRRGRLMEIALAIKIQEAVLRAALDRGVEEFDLEQKIDLEIKMREGSTKLLAACRHQAQTLEAAKNLLTSNERMSAYMAELQRRKKDPPARPLGTQPCLARVSLSDLRMPLIWRDTDHFKNKGDYRRFAVFCLARIGTEIYDTTLLCPVDRSLTDLTFPDVLFFNNIPPDFEFKLEVYSHILQDDLSIASTPRKIKKTIHSSISRTVGKKLAATLKDELNTGKIGPHFELMATARLSLDEVHDSIHTHDMQVENLENKSHQLPLFGHFCCRLAAQPDCISQEVCSGDIMILDGEDRSGQWTPVWAQLQAFRLDVWNRREHWEQGQEPMRSVTVDRNTLIQPKKSKEISISNLREGKEDPSIMRTKSTDEQQKWIRCLVQHTKDHFRWKHAAENVMEIQSPGSTRHSFTRQLRQGSLYDETPLIESVNSDYHRPTVQEIFGMTPSTSLSSCASSSSSPTFRERSYSSGGGNKGRVSATGTGTGTGTGTVRSHWPFTRNNQE